MRALLPIGLLLCAASFLGTLALRGAMIASAERTPFGLPGDELPWVALLWVALAAGLVGWLLVGLAFRRASRAAATLPVGLMFALAFGLLGPIWAAIELLRVTGALDR